MGLIETLAGKLQAAGGADFDASALKGKRVLFYFSAHWCPPCRNFTPTLIEFYNTLKNDGKNIELVFKDPVDKKFASDLSKRLEI